MNSTIFTRLSLLFMLCIVINACNNNPKQQCNIPKEITYTNQVASIIDIHCFKCHASDVYKEKASRNKIFDYPSLKKSAESGVLIGSITHAQGYIPMPYRRNTKIDSCAIKLLKAWVDQGMKE